MLFKYNHKNPSLTPYYNATVENARTQAKNDIRIWRILFNSFLVVTVVVLLLLAIFVFGDAIKIMTDSEYVTAKVLTDTLNHLLVIFAFSTVLFVLSGLCVKKANLNADCLEKEIAENAKN